MAWLSAARLYSAAGGIIEANSSHVACARRRRRGSVIRWQPGWLDGNGTIAETSLVMSGQMRERSECCGVLERPQRELNAG